MFRNILVVAWRNLFKSRLYSLVNIGSLTIGIAASLLIGMFIYTEFSFDRFNVHANKLVRVTEAYTVNGELKKAGMTGSKVGPQLSSAFPEIESYVRIRNFEPFPIRHGTVNFVESRFLFADSTFFSLFTFPLIEGDSRTALRGPNKIVLSESMARKYFGDEKALGKTLTVAGTREYLITGIAKDAPTNSQVQFNFIASYESLSNANAPTWSISIYATYFLLHDLDHLPDLEGKIRTYMDKQPDRNQGKGDYLTYFLEPLTRVHLFSPLSGLEPNGSITYVSILAAIAFLLLCVACVNYTNLATAQSARRIPEIGVRKALGSGWHQLFWQFIGESFLLNFISFLLAVTLVSAFLPGFNQLVERSLTPSDILHPPILVGMLVTYVLISFAAGVYPALILARLRVIRILRAGFSFTGGKGTLKKALIVFQFSVSVFLIIATLIVLQQLSFIQNKNPGYTRDRIVVFPVDAIMRRDFTSLKEAFSRVPGVEAMSCGAEEISSIRWDDEMRTVHDGSTPAVFVHASPTDQDFVNTMGLQIIAGRDFTLEDWNITDSVANSPEPETFYLLNESAVRALGSTPEQIINQTIYRGLVPGRVVGVVKDFNFEPLRNAISPLMIFLNARRANIFQAYIRISGKDMPATLSAIGATWNDRVTHRPFQYHLLEDSNHTLYRGEEQTARMFSVFSTLAIGLACLGLFTLSAYTTLQRAKEIGIRKVFGAGTGQIVTLVSREFMLLILVAVGVAFPVSWLFAENWLRSFAYHVEIHAWVFGIAGISAVLVGGLTVGVQALRSARVNPVNSLRSE
jgi:putative ABC transport system permease protein